MLLLLCLLALPLWGAEPLSHYFLHELSPADTLSRFRPIALAFDAQGGLFVCDGEKGTVFQFNDAGKQTGSGSQRLLEPAGMARTQGFALYVADAERQTIVRFTDLLTASSSFVLNESTERSFFTPCAVAVSKSGQLFCADKEQGDLLLLNTEGGKSSLVPFVKPSPPPFHPHALAASHQLYIADPSPAQGLYRLDRFGNRLEPLAKNLSIPMHGLAVSDSILLAADTLGRCLIRMNLSGTPIDTFLTTDSTGTFRPGALCLQGNALALILPETNKVRRYRLPPPKIISP